MHNTSNAHSHTPPRPIDTHTHASEHARWQTLNPTSVGMQMQAHTHNLTPPPLYGPHPHTNWVSLPSSTALLPPTTWVRRHNHVILLLRTSCPWTCGPKRHWPVPARRGMSQTPRVPLVLRDREPVPPAGTHLGDPNTLSQGFKFLQLLREGFDLLHHHTPGRLRIPIPLSWDSTCSASTE